MNIHKFTPGQHITRTEPVYVKQPAEMNHSLGIMIDQEPLAKFDFVGSDLVLLGVINGVINVHVVGGYRYQLPLHRDYPCDWSEGWAEYEHPLEVEAQPMEQSKPVRDPRFLWLAGWLFMILCCCIWAHYDPEKLTPLETAFVLGVGIVWVLVCYFNSELGNRLTRRTNK